MDKYNFEKVPTGIFDKVRNNKQQFVEKFIDDLEELFPETVKDGKVDFDALLERFGEYQNREEKYELTWVGKNKAVSESYEDIVGRTLKYVEEESRNPETTENLYIEGDNLEVLKLLRNSYYGKIKMIYIDPPYNTGNDFIYKDDFTLSKEEYDRLKGDVNEYGERLVKNSADSGRYHSNWLNMIYPRLQVAKDLLIDDGVIFISIDDNEVHNLRKICDEIFGEDNFVGKYIKQSKVGGGSDSKYIVKEHEYCLCYGKSIADLQEMFIEHDENYLKRYKEEDETGRFFWDTFARPGLQLQAEESLNYAIECPDGSKIKTRWIRSKERFEKEYKEGIVRIINKPNGGWSVQFKQYLNVKGKKPRSMTMDFGGTIEGKNEITELFYNDKIFSYPKSIVYIKQILKTVTIFNKNATILDFFSGSATTAHAVMQLNAEDDGNRKYIMVQLPEPTGEKSEAYKAGYKTVSEIGKERIRRAGDKILENNKDKEGIENLDIGFKVFRVENTNFKRVKDIVAEGLTIEQHKAMSLKDKEDFNPHFTDLDVVYELILKRQDIKLTEEIKNLDKIGDRTYIVGDTMLVCLEDKVTEGMVEQIGNLDTDLSWIVLRDSAFDDNCELKINTVNKLRTFIRENREKEQRIYWI